MEPVLDLGDIMTEGALIVNTFHNTDFISILNRGNFEKNFTWGSCPCALSLWIRYRSEPMLAKKYLPWRKKTCKRQRVPARGKWYQQNNSLFFIRRYGLMDSGKPAPSVRFDSIIDRRDGKKNTDKRMTHVMLWNGKN